MKQEDIVKTFDEAKTTSPKRKFTQSYEIVLTLKGLNMKNPENHVDLYITLPKGLGKDKKVCALIDSELKDAASKQCDKFVLVEDFPKFQSDKKGIKKLANEYDFFIAQATVMPKVAQTFGRVFGPRGKMPNPKAGCVVPPTVNLTPVVARLKNTVRAMAKTQTAVQVMFGTEEMADEDLIANALHVYNQVIHKLPQEENNIKDVFIKKSMGPSFKVGAEKVKDDKAEEKKQEVKEEKKEEKKETKTPEKAESDKERKQKKEDKTAEGE